MHWAKFDEARAAAPDDLARILAVAQRFYTPLPLDFASNERFAGEMLSMLLPPYDLTQLLYRAEQEPSWRLAVVGRRDTDLLIVGMARKNDGWVSHPHRGITLNISIIDDHSHGGTLKEMIADSLRPAQSTDEERGYAESLALAILNLNVMLGLKNVKAACVPAPAALNKKRERNGKRTLYDYHVLEVDGERWETATSCRGLGSGVRSHLRRGHDRVLQDRKVRVRPAFVRGGVPGFVDKDYLVTA